MGKNDGANTRIVRKKTINRSPPPQRTGLIELTAFDPNGQLGEFLTSCWYIPMAICSLKGFEIFQAFVP